MEYKEYKKFMTESKLTEIRSNPDINKLYKLYNEAVILNQIIEYYIENWINKGD